MPDEPRPFSWTAQRSRAAQLVAEDLLTNQQIADAVKLSRGHLDRLKTVPDFAARVAEIREVFFAAVVRQGIAEREQRVAHLNRDHDALLQIVAERGAEPGMQDVPGGRTGFLVRTYKQLGSGDGAERVVEYAVDTGLLRELREIKKHVAIEMGQWTEKRDVTSGGKPLPPVHTITAILPGPDEPATELEAEATE